MKRNTAVENIYPLSPMQQGMLFHSLSDEDTAIYFEQACYTLRKDLNVAAFRQSWDHIVKQHPILRTAFMWKHKGEPLQVVYRRARIPWREDDWRGSNERARVERLA